MYSKIKKSYKKLIHWMAFQPPGALTSAGWKSFNNEFKVKAPIRYWFHRDFRRKFTLPIRWKYEKITDWVRYRTYDRHHILSTGLEPGYTGADTKMLHVNFNILKDFVEVELAWNKYCWNREDKNTVKNSWMYKYIPLYHYWFREPHLGLKHLEWAATLDDPALPPHERCDRQAVSAREILILYKWWVEVRPNRKEIPYFYFEKSEDIDDIFDDIDRDADDYKLFEKNIEDRDNQNTAWDDEDNNMLIRLIKIRKDLWT